MAIKNPILITPSGGQGVVVNAIFRFEWQFVPDDSETQDTYKVDIFNIDNTTAFTSGTVVSSSEFYDLPASSITTNKYYKSTVTVVSGGVTKISNTTVFFAEDAPSVTVDAISSTLLDNLVDNGSDYENWTIAGTGTTKDANGIHLVADSTNDIAEVAVSSPQTTTDYTIFVNITATDASGSFATSSNSFDGGNTLLGSVTTGLHNFVVTTGGSLPSSDLELIMLGDNVDTEFIDFQLLAVVETDQSSLTIQTPVPFGEFYVLEKQFLNFTATYTHAQNVSVKEFEWFLYETDLFNYADNGTTYGNWYSLTNTTASADGLDMTSSGGASARLDFASKDSTLYTLFVKIDDIDVSAGGTNGLKLIANSSVISADVSINELSGVQSVTFTTKSSVGSDNNIMIGLDSGVTTGEFVDNLKVLALFEGDQTDLDITEELAYGQYDNLIDQSGVITGSDIEYEFTGLVDATVYKVDVTVTNQDNVTVDSDRPVFLTDFDSPTAPDTIDVSVHDPSHSILVDWSAVVAQTGTATGSITYVTGVWNQAVQIDSGCIVYDLVAPIPKTFSMAVLIKMTSNFDGVFLTLLENGVAKYKVGYINSKQQFYYERDFRITKHNIATALPAGFFEFYMTPEEIGYKISGTTYTLR